MLPSYEYWCKACFFLCFSPLINTKYLVRFGHVMAIEKVMCFSINDPEQISVVQSVDRKADCYTRGLEFDSQVVTVTGYSKQCHNISKLIEHADDKLFRSLRSPAHCAHYLLPPVKPAVRTLRPRGHNYILPKCNYALYKNSFLCRHLYSKSSTRTNKI